MKKNYGKLILMILIVFVTVFGSISLALYQSGMIKLPKVQNIDIPKTVAESVPPENEIYSGDKLGIYTAPGITQENMEIYILDFGGMITDDSHAEDGYYEITLKDSIPEQDKKHFLTEIRNHIAVSEAWFID